MQNPLMTILTNQIKSRYPQAFQMVEQMRRNNGNPMELFKQVTGNFTPEQMNGFFTQAKNIGFPQELLQQVQNGINTK